MSRRALLAGARAKWDSLAVGTFWLHGKLDTHNGQRFSQPWNSFAEELRDYSHEIVEKGSGVWFSPALTSNGRCRDQDVNAITQLAFDADGVGDWQQFCTTLDSAGLAYIVQRSATHCSERAKWHAHVPLSLHWIGSKEQWRQIYRHSVGWFSVMAGLRIDLSVPLFGFDLATDRLAQPWYLAARRSVEQNVPETLCQTGFALDLETFLRDTSFKFQAAQAPLARTKRAARGPSSGGSHAPAALLCRAFQEAGWLGQQLRDGAIAALCPWRDQHGSGADFDSSTVIFPPSPGRRLGWFHCSHAHCRCRKQSDVWEVLPPSALRIALTSKQ